MIAGFALPAWLISVLLHAGLIAALTTITWTVVRKNPDPQFTVGIMVKKDSPLGQDFESKDTTFVARDVAIPQMAKFLPDAEPMAIAQSLPGLPAADLSVIGLSGSIGKGTGGLLAVPDSGIAFGTMANTRFFGAQVWGSKFVYVIDRSGSMSQRDRLAAAKRELLASLSTLPPETQFQIIFYNQHPSVLKSGGITNQLMVATDRNKKLAEQFLDQVVAEGGTEHLPALKMALLLKPDVIFFLTDADDLRAHEVREATEANRDQAKIHTIEFGVGADIERENQLRELAKLNGGTYRYIDSTKLDRLGQGGVR